MSQMSELVRKFPDSLVKQKPGAFKAAYVDHATIVQRLLEVVGPYSFEVKQPISNPDGTISGCLAALSCTIDGFPVVIVEVGDCERPGDSNAQNLQMAASSALKRCAMRLGVGLHLWAGDAYYIDRALEKREGGDV